jgi:hypothetical protein
MNTVDIRIKGVKNVSSLYALFKANNTWHMPFRMIADNEYEITLRENDPLVSFLSLRYT